MSSFPFMIEYNDRPLIEKRVKGTGRDLFLYCFKIFILPMIMGVDPMCLDRENQK